MLNIENDPEALKKLRRQVPEKKQKESPRPI